MAIDDVDLVLLESLTQDGRASFAELAVEVGLSAPSTADRVRRLEDRGVIRGYSARLDPGAIDRGLTAFIAVSIDDPKQTRALLKAIDQCRDVVECHHVAGDDDYLLKVHVNGTSGLEALVAETLKSVRGIRTRTTVVLSTPLDRPLSLGPDSA